MKAGGRQWGLKRIEVKGPKKVVEERESRAIEKVFNS